MDFDFVTAGLGVAASSLGSYNIARYVITKGIQKRRERKERKQLHDDVRKALAFARDTYTAAVAGDFSRVDAVKDKYAALKESYAKYKAAQAEVEVAVEADAVKE